jgi:tetratricopeptide (TPR) repeat protein
MEKTRTVVVGELLRVEEVLSEETFFDFVEACNELTFENPKEGLELARHAPALAEKVAPGSKRPALIHMTAYAVLGSAFRAVGNYRDADKAFATAALHSKTLSDLERAELKRRMTYLRLDQRRVDEARELIDEAIGSYRQDGDLKNRHFLGCCYLARGNIHCETGSMGLAVVDYTESLNHIQLKRDPKVYYSAVHNLAVALADCRDREALDRALQSLREAQQRVPYRGRHMAKFKLKWLMGLIYTVFGLTRHAVRLLYRARDGLIELGAAYEVALISLDLALVYLDECRPAWEIEALAAETHRLFRDLSADQEALAALAIWRKAAAEKELTHQIVRTVRATVAERSKPAM